MKDKAKERRHFDNTSCVYGPVASWRFGRSLGIDPIFQTSTCSFNCIYCQLGHIQRITKHIQIYVETDKVLSDYRHFLAKGASFDVITYSGSGEPTLAANLAEIIRGVRHLSPDIPQVLLTNATELIRDEALNNVQGLDRIIVKIDAPDEETFRLINRPAKGVTLERTLRGIEKLKASHPGQIEVQSMLMPLNSKQEESFARILLRIAPEVVQLNTPKRPWPMEWHRENRGNHLKIYDYETKTLKTLPAEQIEKLRQRLQKRLPDSQIFAVP